MIPKDAITDYTILDGWARKNGVIYSTADGGELPNLGEQQLSFRTHEGHNCGVTFQVADVKRPLLSVTALTSKGNRVSFDSSGGTITNASGDRVIRFNRRRGVYILDIYVAPFQGQGR